MSDRWFTSGITFGNEFLINMEAYLEKEIPICFRLSSGYHGLAKEAFIKPDEYIEVWMKFTWEGNVFHSEECDKEEKGSYPIRKYKIYGLEQENKEVIR